jgi:hypothetical protein
MGLSIDGKTGMPTATPAVTASSAYSTGQVVGGLLTFSPAFRFMQTAVLASLCLADKANNKVAYDIFFFSSKPAGTYTDGAAFAPSAADLLLLSGFVSVLSTSWSGGTGNAIAVLNAIGQVLLNRASGATTDEPVQLNANLNLYAVIVARSAPTFNTAADLQLSLGIVQD